MADEDNDSVIDLTRTNSFTLADHNRLNNVVIVVDTDDSLREEDNIQPRVVVQRNNRRHYGGRKRRHSRNRAAVDDQVPVQDLCTPDNKNKISKHSKEKTITEEPEKKKAKTSLGSCPICFDDFCGQALASTKCGHVFCIGCLKQALKKEPRCPTCRTWLKGKTGYHSLFL